MSRLRIGCGRSLGIVLAVVLILGAGGAFLVWRATIPPTPSAFYDPPDPLPEGLPGTLIRSAPITAYLPEGARAWRVLYLSTGLDGEAIPVSGVVIAPVAAGETPRPVVAWAHGTTGVIPACGTSHAPNPFERIPDVARLIRAGYVVAATDYAGLGVADSGRPGIHLYLDGPTEAAAVLDSVRAARQLDVNAGERVVVWGASQGGQAALWTAQRAADYAPELTLLGAATSAPAIDFAGIFRTGMDTLGGGVVLSKALYAWSAMYGPGASLDDIIQPDQREHFERLARTCITTPLAFLTIGGLLTPTDFLSADPLTTAPWRTYIAGATPRDPIAVPILIAHGTADSLVPFEESQAEVARRCALGEDIQLIPLDGVEHDGAVEAAPRVIDWIADRFAGRPTAPSCAT